MLLKKTVFLLLLLMSQQAGAASDLDLIDQLYLHSQIILPPNQTDVRVKLTIYFVWGGRVDLSERIVGWRIIDEIRSRPFDFQPEESNVTVTFERPDIIELEENATSAAALENLSGIIILMGGPAHNSLTAEYRGRGVLGNVSTKLGGQYSLAKGNLPSGSQIVSYSHNYAGEEREAVKYSPLRWLESGEYIPITATGIGTLLIVLANLIKTVIEVKASDKGKVWQKERPIMVRGVEVNEYFAVFGASFVLGLSVTWVYFGPNAGFLWALAVNTAVSLATTLSHDLSHKLMGKALGIRSKYRLWWGGSAVTLISGYLGNAFGVQGFLREYDTEGASKRNLGIMKAAAPLMSIAVAAAAAFLFARDPNMIYRTAFVTASLGAMAEILPMKSLDGDDIRRWSTMAWATTFAAISAIFLYINFLM
jgi:hypothetical protein